MERRNYLKNISSEKGGANWAEAGFGLAIAFIAAGWAGQMIVSEINKDEDYIQSNPTPTPIEQDINSFENSFTSDLQLNPTPHILK